MQTSAVTLQVERVYSKANSMIMALENGFCLPEIPCSNMDLVTYMFIVTENKEVINQGFKRYIVETSD